MSKYIGKEEARFSGFNGKELTSGLEFTMTITNATSAAKVIALTPAHYDTLKIISTENANVDTITKTWNDITAINAAGHAVDCVAADGTTITNVTCAGKQSTIKEFFDYIKRNPVRVVETVFQPNIKDLYESALVVKKVSPFKKVEEHKIELQNYFSENQFQDKKVTVTEPIQLDDQTLITLEIPATVTRFTITFRIGAISNHAGEFDSAIVQTSYMASANALQK
jgi:hypothetical protein